MPPSKKLKLKQGSTELASNRFQTLPTTILRQILLHAVEKSRDARARQQALFALCGLSKATRSALLSDAYRAARVDDVQWLSLLARTIKVSPKIASSIRELSISIEDIYSRDLGNKKASTWKGHSLKHILVACNSLQHLTLDLGPSSASSPVSYLLRDLSPAFKPLICLVSFTLHASEIWMHDLASILAVLPSLRSLEVDALLRGDTHTNRLDPDLARPALEVIKSTRNTLVSQHVRWLLEGQNELRVLEMALPREGREAERAFDAIEQVAEGLRSLRLTSSWSTPKSTAAESTKEERSLILPTLTRAPSTLTSLRLTSNFAPSSSLAQIFSLPFDHLKTLEIEDTVQSGMRVALEEALGGGGGGEEWNSDVSDDEKIDVDDGERKVVLPRLAEVISFGVKRGNMATSESGKSFKRVCKSRGIKWRID